MSDIDEEQVARLRVALARIARGLDRRTVTDDLTGTQLSVLGTIARSGPIGAGEIADVERLNPTMLSRVLSKLESRGLIARTADDRDRRAVVVQMTPAGRRLHQRRKAQRTRLLVERLERLPEGHAALLLDVVPALEELGDELAREASTV